MSRCFAHASRQPTNQHGGWDEKMIRLSCGTPHKLRWWKNTLPLTLGFLEEARASSQKLRKHLSDGSHYRLELRRCEIAQTQVLPVIGAVMRYARDGHKQKIER